jgi:LEA14-like dessication related protein
MGQKDYSHCQQILLNSKADIFITDKSKSIYENLYSWIESTSYEEYKKQRSDGIGIDITIPIDDIPLGQSLNSNTTKDEYTNIQKAIREGKVKGLDINDQMNVIKSITNPEVYKAWSECIKSVDGDPVIESDKIKIKKIIINSDEIIIILKFISEYPENSPIVQDIYIPNCVTCVSGQLKIGDTIKGEHTMIFKRNSYGQGSFSLDTTYNSLIIPLIPTLTSSLIERIEPEIEKYVNEEAIRQLGNCYTTYVIFEDGKRFDFDPVDAKINIIQDYLVNLSISIPYMPIRIDPDKELSIENCRTGTIARTTDLLLFSKSNIGKLTYLYEDKEFNLNLSTLVQIIEECIMYSEE